MASEFRDHRGVIRDLLGPVDAVTEIFTRGGAVRGNHIHANTVQFTYVCWGRLLMVQAINGELIEREYGHGMTAPEERGIPHAWKALEDTLVLVFTKGPRSGEAYETDTIRLEEPLL